MSVIDFDDAGFGWHAFDLAVAIWDGLDASTGQTYFNVARDALFEGYRIRRPGCKQIVALVPLFLLIRSLIVLAWMQDRPEGGYTQMIPPLLAHALTSARALNWSEFSTLEETE